MLTLSHSADHVIPQGADAWIAVPIVEYVEPQPKTKARKVQKKKQSSINAKNNILNPFLPNNLENTKIHHLVGAGGGDGGGTTAWYAAAAAAAAAATGGAWTAAQAAQNSLVLPPRRASADYTQQHVALQPLIATAATASLSAAVTGTSMTANVGAQTTVLGDDYDSAHALLAMNFTQHLARAGMPAGTLGAHAAVPLPPAAESIAAQTDPLNWSLSWSGQAAETQTDTAWPARGSPPPSFLRQSPVPAPVKVETASGPGPGMLLGALAGTARTSSCSNSSNSSNDGSNIGGSGTQMKNSATIPLNCNFGSIGVAGLEVAVPAPAPSRTIVGDSACPDGGDGSGDGNRRGGGSTFKADSEELRQQLAQQHRQQTGLQQKLQAVQSATHLPTAATLGTPPSAFLLVPNSASPDTTTTSCSSSSGSSNGGSNVGIFPVALHSAQQQQHRGTTPSPSAPGTTRVMAKTASVATTATTTTSVSTGSMGTGTEDLFEWSDSWQQSNVGTTPGDGTVTGNGSGSGSGGKVGQTVETQTAELHAMPRPASTESMSVQTDADIWGDFWASHGASSSNTGGGGGGSSAVTGRYMESTSAQTGNDLLATSLVWKDVPAATAGIPATAVSPGPTAAPATTATSCRAGAVTTAATPAVSEDASESPKKRFKLDPAVLLLQTARTGA